MDRRKSGGAGVLSKALPLRLSRSDEEERERAVREASRGRGPNWRPLWSGDWAPRLPDERPRQLRSPRAPKSLRRAAEVVELLLELGPTIDAPVPLVFEVTWAAVRVTIECARPSDAAEPSPYEAPIPRRVWAAAAFAALDGPQWEHLLQSIVRSERGAVASPVADRDLRRIAFDFSTRRAAWTFGVGLPPVCEACSTLQRWFKITHTDDRWRSPATRAMLPELLSAAREIASAAFAASVPPSRSPSLHAEFPP